MPKRQRVLHTRSVISVPCSVEDGKRIVRASQLEGVAVSRFVREAAVEKADRILAKQQRDSQQERAALPATG
jgi:uncharacterized protein (DUF1778 family)